MKKYKRYTMDNVLHIQKALFDSVSDETAGRALKAIFKYFDNEDKETINITPLEFAVFSCLKLYFDESMGD